MQRAGIFESRMSYYPTGLLVLGWTAGLIYDTPKARPTYILSRLLSDVYRSLAKGNRLLGELSARS